MVSPTIAEIAGVLNKQVEEVATTPAMIPMSPGTSTSTLYADAKGLLTGIISVMAVACWTVVLSPDEVAPAIVPGVVGWGDNAVRQVSIPPPKLSLVYILNPDKALPTGGLLTVCTVKVNGRLETAANPPVTVSFKVVVS